MRKDKTKNSSRCQGLGMRDEQVGYRILGGSPTVLYNILSVAACFSEFAQTHKVCNSKSELYKVCSSVITWCHSVHIHQLHVDY